MRTLNFPTKPEYLSGYRFFSPLLEIDCRVYINTFATLVIAAFWDCRLLLEQLFSSVIVAPLILFLATYM